MTQTAQKLMMLQLWRGGFPIAPDTVAKALDLPNFGTIDGNSEIERWTNWKKHEIEIMSQVQQLGGSLQGAAQQAGTQPPPPGPGKAAPGRPPTGRKPPAAITKSGPNGPRPVISESGK